MAGLPVDRTLQLSRHGHITIDCFFLYHQTGLIVIPLYFVDPEDLPVFKVLGVPEEIALEFLAIRLSVDLNKFKYNNAIDDDPIPKQGIGKLYLVLDRPLRKCFPKKD